MCLQCMTEAQLLIRDVVPGYSLMVATKDHKDWPAGYYGLVRMNDPDFVWGTRPRPDPWGDLTDEEIEQEEGHAEWDDWAREVNESIGRVRLSPVMGYDLVCACMSVGYEPDEDGVIWHWLMHRMGKQLQELSNQETKKGKASWDY